MWWRSARRLEAIRWKSSRSAIRNRPARFQELPEACAPVGTLACRQSHVRTASCADIHGDAKLIGYVADERFGVEAVATQQDDQHHKAYDNGAQADFRRPHPGLHPGEQRRAGA